MKRKLLFAGCVLSLMMSVAACGEADSKGESVVTEVEKIPMTEESVSEEAVSVNEKALQAYKDMLKAAPAMEGDPDEIYDASFGYEENKAKFGNHIDYFAIVDLNDDNVPELITISIVNFRWAPSSVYTYTGKEVMLIKNPDENLDYCTFDLCSVANGSYEIYVCDENHIHSVWRGTDIEGNAAEENRAYVLEGTTLKAVECSPGEENAEIDFRSNTTENMNF